MWRVFKWLTISVVLLAVLAGGGAAVGYYIHKWRIGPVYSLAERAEVRLRRDLGLKTDIELAVERIETIFLTLKGRVHVMPDRTFQNGGALTVWDEDLIVMHKTGQIFWLDRDQEEGLQRAPLTLPDNGFDGYVKLAADKYPGRMTRADALRFNDIEYINSGAHRGLLLSYTFVDVEQECYRSRVSWLALPDTVTSIRDAEFGPDDWEIAYDSDPCLEFNESAELMVAYTAGGRIGFKAPNLVYLGNGDYHREGIYRPDSGIQDDNSDYGKVVEINLDTRTSRHVSKGHRNLQGMVVTREGEIWTTEHGLRGGDELNQIVEGENYGWPIEDMGTLYSGVPQDSPSGPGRHTTYKAPVFAWVPSAAVSSVTQIDGFHDAWDGDLLVSSLKNRTLYRIRVHGDRLVSMEPIPVGFRTRDVMQWGPDRIAMWMDLNEVVVFEIEERTNPLVGMTDRLIADGMNADLAERATQTLSACNECHSYESDIHGAGPSLAGVVGRAPASTAFNGYSDGLLSQSGTWNEERLATYLTEPEAVVEGTLMTGLGVGDAELAGAVAKALSTIIYKPR